jgi:hypothetical protein
MAIFLRAINPSKYLFFAAITISVMLFIGYSILLTKRLEVTAESSKISTTFKSQIKEIGEDYQLLAVPTAVTNNVFRYWTFTEYAFSEIKHMEILNELILRKNNRIEVVSQSVITDKNPTISFDGVNLYYIGAYGTIKPALFPDLPIYFFNGKDLVKY